MYASCLRRLAVNEPCQTPALLKRSPSWSITCWPQHDVKVTALYASFMDTTTTVMRFRVYRCIRLTENIGQRSPKKSVSRDTSHNKDRKVPKQNKSGWRWLSFKQQLGERLSDPEEDRRRSVSDLRYVAKETGVSTFLSSLPASFVVVFP